MKKKSLFVCFTIVGALLILFTGAQAESPATAAISAGGIVITPPAIADFEAMNVRIMSPDGVMVLNTQSMVNPLRGHRRRATRTASTDTKRSSSHTTRMPTRGRTRVPTVRA